MSALKKLGDIYIEALTEVVSTTSGILLDVDSRKSNKNFDEVTGVMYLHGQKTGMLFITAKESDIRILCANMIGAKPSEVSKEEIDDTMCELVNMTAGRAKLQLGDTEYMFSLLQPFVIKGKNVSIVTKSIAKIEAGSLTNGNITVRFIVVY